MIEHMKFSAAFTGIKAKSIKDDNENVVVCYTFEKEFDVADGNAAMAAGVPVKDSTFGEVLIESCNPVKIGEDDDGSPDYIDFRLTLKMAVLATITASADTKAGVKVKWEIQEQCSLDEMRNRLGDLLPVRAHDCYVTGELYERQTSLDFDGAAKAAESSIMGLVDTVADGGVGSLTISSGGTSITITEQDAKHIKAKAGRKGTH